MALVSSTPRLHILNASLADGSSSSKGRVGPSTAVLSVDRLHEVWSAAGMVAGHNSRGLLGAGGGGGMVAAAGGAGGSQQQQGQQLQQQLSGVVGGDESQLRCLLGPKADLALLAILSNGNDYLPSVRGCPKLEDLWAR